jgi:hypothetical protein
LFYKHFLSFDNCVLESTPLVSIFLGFGGQGLNYLTTYKRVSGAVEHGLLLKFCDFAHGCKKCAFLVNFLFFEEKVAKSHRNRLKIAKFQEQTVFYGP